MQNIQANIPLITYISLEFRLFNIKYFKPFNIQYFNLLNIKYPFGYFLKI